VEGKIASVKFTAVKPSTDWEVESNQFQLRQNSTV
jgi:hypothetical protein